MRPQPPVELQVTLGVPVMGDPAKPSAHCAVHTLLTGLAGEQLNAPLVGLGGGKIQAAGTGRINGSLLCKQRLPRSSSVLSWFGALLKANKSSL